MESLVRRLLGRPHFEVTRPDGRPYLWRWHLIPKNRFFNIFLHKFISSDWARDPHDHPWAWASLGLKGSYFEYVYVIRGNRPRLFDMEIRRAGKIHFAGLHYIHMVHVLNSPVWTLFITGPHRREWGFWTKSGWVSWKNYDGDSLQDEI